MTAATRLVSGLLLCTCSCNTTLEVNLVRGECDEQHLAAIRSVMPQLRRVEGRPLNSEKCIEVPAAGLSGVAALRQLLSEGTVFPDDLPAGGQWIMRLLGAPFSACPARSATTLCGRTQPFAFPPANHRLELKLDCIAATDCSYQLDPNKVSRPWCPKSLCDD